MPKKTNRLKMYADITKVDEDQRMVYGYASTTSLDSQNERISKGALEKALPEYMRFANIREMHTNSAVGTAQSATIDERGLYIQAHVVDDNAWKKIKAGVYKGFSVGGQSLSKVKDEIREMKLTEISLVDRPANPECVIDLYKADGLDENKIMDELKVAVVSEQPAHQDDADAKAVHDAKEIKDDSSDKDVAPIEAEDKKLDESVAESSPVQPLDAIKEAEPVELAEKPEDIKKADASVSQTDANDAKSSNPNSDTAIIDIAQRMHDSAIELGASCEDMSKAESNNDIEKVNKLNDIVKGLETERDTLKKRVEELEKTVVPAKGVQKVVSISKEDDAGLVEKADITPKTPVDVIKKLHNQGPTFKIL